MLTEREIHRIAELVAARVLRDVVRLIHPSALHPVHVSAPANDTTQPEPPPPPNHAA